MNCPVLDCSYLHYDSLTRIREPVQAVLGKICLRYSMRVGVRGKHLEVAFTIRLSLDPYEAI